MRIIAFLSVFLALNVPGAAAQRCPSAIPTQRLGIWTNPLTALQDRTRFDDATASYTRSISDLGLVLPRSGSRQLTPTLEAMIEAAMGEFVSEVEVQSGRQYVQRNLVADFQEMRRNREPSHRWPRDVYVTQILLETRCVDARATVHVRGVYAIVPRVVDPSIVRGAVAALDRRQVVEFAGDGRGGGSFTINIYNIIQQARTNPSVRDSLRLGVERFYRLPQAEERLLLADEYSRGLIEHVRDHGEIPVRGFDSGEYGISSFMVAVIERLVVPQLTDILRRTQGPVDVVSIGHTDARAVRRPVGYGGCGDLSGAAGRLAPYDPRAPCPPARQIANNNQLSFARGYAGAELLYQIFPVERGRARLRIRYTGVGSREASNDEGGSRRIVYRIVSQQLRD